MTPRRSLSLPKLSGLYEHQAGRETTMTGGRNRPTHLHVVPDPSRDMSKASTASSLPSNRGHSRWPSSGSSVATSSPDSPANVTKSALDDLVEDPSERDEPYGQRDAIDSVIEPLCICDSPFCEHRRNGSFPSAGLSPTSPRFGACFGSGAFPDDDTSDDVDSPIERRGSNGSSREGMPFRMGSRWGSLSKRWRKGNKSVSNASVRSAPSSRASSVMHGQSYANHFGLTPSFAPANLPPEWSRNTETVPSPKRPSTLHALGVAAADYADESIDGPERSPTPLLPPVMTDMRKDSADQFQSPLESPTVAIRSPAASFSNSPSLTPATTGLWTPPLSAKPSFASIGRGRSKHGPHGSCDMPPMNIPGEDDFWADKLGHSNFHIVPEPYLPAICDRNTCTQLLDDWETARREYMRLAIRIGESYGDTSITFKLAGLKWGQIDALWRHYFEKANTILEAWDRTAALQSLPDMQPLSQIPSLSDPQNPEKFPTIDSADIVGPMVQHVKAPPILQNPPTKKSFLKLFTPGRK